MPWHNACKTSALADGAGTSVILPGRKKPIALFNNGGVFFAVADECSHAYAPLAGGRVTDHIVTCPWHGARFDVRTGVCLGPGPYSSIRTFPARAAGDDIQIEV